MHHEARTMHNDNCRTSRLHKDVQNRMLGTDKTCSAHAYISMSRKALELLPL